MSWSKQEEIFRPGNFVKYIRIHRFRILMKKLYVYKPKLFEPKNINHCPSYLTCRLFFSNSSLQLWSEETSEDGFPMAVNFHKFFFSKFHNFGTFFFVKSLYIACVCTNIWAITGTFWQKMTRKASPWLPTFLVFLLIFHEIVYVIS